VDYFTNWGRFCKITNRATGNIDAIKHRMCVCRKRLGMSNQKWLVGGASAASSPMFQTVSRRYPSPAPATPRVGRGSPSPDRLYRGYRRRLWLDARRIIHGGERYLDRRVSPSGTTGTTVDVTVTNYHGTSATSTSDKFIYNSNSWNNTSWQLRQQITIYPTLVGGGQKTRPTFPVLISLSGLSTSTQR